MELVLCVAVLVVAPPSRRGTCGCEVELSKRFDDFGAGLWTQLHKNAELTPFTKLEAIHHDD